MPPSGAGRAYASAHYMVARDGEVIELMPPEKQAYHAGKSELAGAENLNAWTVGIELIGTGDSGFTDDQYSSLTHLCADLITKHQIPLECIVGHEDVAAPKGRKVDPGPLFDWERLRGPLRGIE